MAQNNDCQPLLPRGDLKMKATDVEACRICLETNNKLYSLQDTHLGSCMKAIGGFTNPYLPNFVCYECAPILIKCQKLIEKGKTAQATLLDIFEKNGQITKALIEDQNRSQLNLQSSLDCHLLINYYYIKYDDDDNTSEFVKTETKPDVLIEMKIEDKEIQVETKEENTETEELEDVSIEEKIIEDIPVIEVSDDETIPDVIFSLAPYRELGEKIRRMGTPKGISHVFHKPPSDKQKKKAEKRKLWQNSHSIVKSEDSTNSDKFPREFKNSQENFNTVKKTRWDVGPNPDSQFGRDGNGTGTGNQNNWYQSQNMWLG